MADQKNALILYHYEGKEYTFFIYADSLKEAEERLRAIRTTSTVLGWPAYLYPTNSLTLPFVAVYVHIVTFIRNLFRLKQ